MSQNVPTVTNSRIKKKLQISFRRWIKNKTGGGSVEKFVGGDIDTVRKHISNQFVPGMNWSNYGEKWVIDHIVPLRLFDMQNDLSCSIAFNYKNIMPLFKEDNLYKEGDLRFSMLILDLREECAVVSTLKEILQMEIGRMDKYLKWPAK